MDKNRRGFMAWLASFFGLGAVAGAANAEMTVVPDKRKPRGFVCLYQNVGQLPPFKAEAFITRLKEQWRKSDERKVFEDWGFVVVPVRPPQETRIVLFDFENGCASDNVEYEAGQTFGRCFRDDKPFEAPDKQQTKDYILMMLGAPVCKIELEDGQLDAAYDHTKEMFDRVSESKGIGLLNMDGFGPEVFKNIMLAKCTIMLGHARRKYQDLNALKMNIIAQNPQLIDKEVLTTCHTGFVLDGEELVKEGNENLIYWTQYLDAI